LFFPYLRKIFSSFFFGTFLSFIFSAKVRQQPEMGGVEGYVQRRDERGVTEKGDAGRGTESEGSM